MKKGDGDNKSADIASKYLEFNMWDGNNGMLLGKCSSNILVIINHNFAHLHFLGVIHHEI